MFRYHVDSCVEWADWVDVAQPGLSSPDDVEPLEALLQASPQCKVQPTYFSLHLTKHFLPSFVL